MNERNVFLRLLEQSLNTFYKGKRDCKQARVHIKNQAWRLNWHIKKEFKTLHGFLNRAEDVMISELTGEEQEKLRMLAEKLDGLGGGISTLLNTIKATKKDK